MFNLFKKGKHNKDKPKLPALMDLNNQPIQEGDIVESLRYDLGRCKINRVGNGYEYESLKTGDKVSWVKMIDATTENQKVKKITEENANS